MKRAMLFFSLPVVPVLGVLLVGLGSKAQAAGSANADLGVSTTLVQNCTITTTDVKFPDYDALSSTPDDGSGSLVVACTKGAQVTLELGQGANYANNSNQMKFDSNTLSYGLFSDNSRQQAWGTGATSVKVQFTKKDPVTTVVYGRIPSGQDMPAGQYTDTVKATVNF